MIGIVVTPSLAEDSDDCFVNEEQFRYCCCTGKATDCWQKDQAQKMFKSCCGHLVASCSTDVEAPQQQGIEAPQEQAPSVPSLPLLDGGSIPMSGVGLCCRPSAMGDAVRQGVLDYLLLGGRHLDDAKLYSNHREVGIGIRQAIQAGVPREEIFFTTKIWPSDYGFESTAAWVDTALEELGLEYIDLVLLHAPGAPDSLGELKCRQPKACRQETWLALQRAQADSKIRHLGVSNFGQRQMGDLLALGGSPITVNQIEFHPWVPQTHLDTAAWCRRNGIVVTAYGSMGSSGLAQQMMMEEALKEIGESHGKTAGQVLLRWAVQQNVTVIPGSSNPAHQAENLRIFDFELSAAQMAALDGVPSEQRMLHFGHTPDAHP